MDSVLVMNQPVLYNLEGIEGDLDENAMINSNDTGSVTIVFDEESINDHDIIREHLGEIIATIANSEEVPEELVFINDDTDNDVADDVFIDGDHPNENLEQEKSDNNDIISDPDLDDENMLLDPDLGTIHNSHTKILLSMTSR